ncbi:methyltransferase domain-containing protein [Ottowia sp.]|uniref:methyltransferase domain-containing protein n=1 Tax=Ottowia sp. TaxID=1898956 RepID=UPI003A8BC8FF
MSATPPALHVYAREIRADERTSLSLLASHITAGARVLDLGCGSGALGRFIAERDGAHAGPIDGLTISADEAQLAQTHYRRVEVANLDQVQLTDVFARGSYDFIVCADVLEHIVHSAQVMAACKTLLAPQGRVLLSIPNVGYSGLVAELMAGEFRYRPEGLLDETHVRFFTRRTLMRFLSDNGWAAEQVDTVQRPLPDSEFQVAFDALAEPVARHLLALPDSLTYQFIVVGRALHEGEQPATPLPADAPLPAQALFITQLYLGQNGSFDEGRKLTQTGVIGNLHQTVRFALPTDAPLSGLRLDPADRNGYVHLHAIRLLDHRQQPLWHWTPHDVAAMAQTPMDGIVAQPPGLAGAPYALLLHGKDPWIKLPIPKAALAHAQGGALEVTLGWPMSADYLALAGHTELRVAQARLAADQARLAQDALQLQLNTQTKQAHMERDTRQSLEQQSEHLRSQKQALLAQIQTLSRERDDATQLVHDIENSTVFRATRPIVNMKMRIDRLLGVGSARPKVEAQRPPSQPLAPADLPVDIIVPVYKGLEDTRRCLESVLASTPATEWRLIVINDASPESEVTEWLRAFAPRDPRIVLLENEENLGFVGTVNRGMAHSRQHDVLLLNSDTEVASTWLDRIRAAAYSDQKVASVTPFSNNATICSYPLFCKDNALPPGWSTAQLDTLFARANAGQVVDVPTGVGFCMYIRRAALEQVGLFDVDNFGKGYGEENDFCIRAARAGWRNLHVLDTFVRHFGGVSFGDSKSPRERAAMDTLRRLHPHYERDVLRFVRDDPARLARAAVDIARIQNTNRPVILAVMHDRAGGTERHVFELAELLHDRAQFLVLRPQPGKCLSLRLPGAGEGFELVFSLPAQGDQLLALLRQLGVCHVHFHHLLGHGKFVEQLPARLGISHDFTAHDFYFADPDITLTDRSGNYCAANDPLVHPVSHDPDLVAWRQHHASLLNSARYVLSPSRDMLTRLLAVVPGAPLRLVPHTDIDPALAQPVPQPAQLLNDRPLRVAVIGALSTIKGADILESAAIAARKQNAPVEFHLLGYGYRTLQTQPHARLTVHGRYDERDLPELLHWLQPDLVWFPAQWPESYSYTLSACLLGGWPVVVPDLGAFAERLAGRHWSWVQPWSQTPQQWLDFFTLVRSQNFAIAQSPEPIAPWTSDTKLTSTRAFEAQPSNWYADTYLNPLPALAPQSISAETLAPFLPAADTGLATGLKGQALEMLARLRAAPALGPIARAIPLHWQTRVKSWLRH